MLEVKWSADVVIGTMDSAKRTCYFNKSMAVRIPRDGLKKSFDQLVVEFYPMEEQKQKIKDHSGMRVNIKIQGTNMISTNIEDIESYHLPAEKRGSLEDKKRYRIETSTKTLESVIDIYKDNITDCISMITFQCNYNDMDRIFTSLFTRDENK